MLSETNGVIAIVTAVFDSLNVPYAIGGSVASSMYGEVRYTNDVDFIAALDQLHIAPFVTALQDRFYTDQSMIADAILYQSSFNLIDLQSFQKVDVFVDSERAFTKLQLERRVQRKIGEDENLVYFVSAEDTILAKLDWYRKGGEQSERQWRDVIGVLKVQGDRLDLVYMRRTAQALNVSDLLEKVLAAANFDLSD